MQTERVRRTARLAVTSMEADPTTNRYHRLWASVTTEAVSILSRTAPNDKRRRQMCERHYNEAICWLLSDAEDFGSFCNVCRLLGYGALRAKQGVLRHLQVERRSIRHALMSRQKKGVPLSTLEHRLMKDFAYAHTVQAIHTIRTHLKERRAA